MLQALAAGACASSVGACGGAVAPAVGDGGVTPADAGADGEVLDSGVDGVSPQDSGCVALDGGTGGFCQTLTFSCLPPDLTLGYNPSCGVTCGGTGCTVTQAAGAQVDLQCVCGTGRLPAGFSWLAPAGDGDPVGSVLARNAALEGAAVRAFEQLASELALHGAPPDLVARARRAARQEVVHERLLRDAAAARGCAVPGTRQSPAPATPRTLLEIARENAVEGCGREALGAALLELQSRRCADPALRRALARIAADELEHAELSWELHGWMLDRLDADSRAEVVAAHEAFLDGCEVGAPPELGDAGVATALGMPSREQWGSLVREVRAGLRRVGAELLAA